MIEKNHNGVLRAPFNESDAYSLSSIKIYALGIILLCVFGFLYALKTQEWILSFMPAVIGLMSWYVIRCVQKIEKRHVGQDSADVEEDNVTYTVTDKRYDINKPVAAIQHMMDVLKQLAAEGQSGNKYHPNAPYKSGLHGDK